MSNPLVDRYASPQSACCTTSRWWLDAWSRGSVEKGISVRTTLVLDVPASAMSSCDGSEQLGCGPSGAATQRRFRLRSRLPARRPPAMTSSAWAAGLCASRSHSRTSFMSRRILSWHCASALGGASEGRPPRMQSRPVLGHDDPRDSDVGEVQAGREPAPRCKQSSARTAAAAPVWRAASATSAAASGGGDLASRGDQGGQIWTEWAMLAYNTDELAVRAARTLLTADSFRAHPSPTNGRATPLRGRSVSARVFPTASI